MKLSYTTKNGHLTVELEGKTQTDLLEQLANFQDVFEQKCVVKQGDQFLESDDLKATVRTVEKDGKEYTYYEWRVNSGPLRGHRLSLGQHQKGGGLYPKRKDENGNWLPNNGWVKWESKKDTNTTKTEESSPF